MQKSYLQPNEKLPIKANQLQVSTAHLISDLFETSIDESPTSRVPPLCETLGKLEHEKKQTNKQSEIVKIQIVYLFLIYSSLEINLKQL